MTIHVRFVVMRETDGSQAAATEAQVAAQLDQLNNAFRPYRIQFEPTGVPITFHNSDRFRYLCANLGVNETCWCDGCTCRSHLGQHTTEEGWFRDEYAVDPQDVLNIYVTGMGYGGAVGLGRFAWCMGVDDVMSGVLIDARMFGGNECGPTPQDELPCRLLVHEVGHTLGLWHTFHGSAEIPTERWDSCCEPGECDGTCSNPECDQRGDLCCDTALSSGEAPYGCATIGEGIVDATCSQVNAPLPAADYTNYMGYAWDGCWNHFTPQQVRRMHCWACDAVSGWIDSPDCNQNGKKDVCDITRGTSGDCNADGVPDECQQRLLYGACCIDGGPPQVCVDTTECACWDLGGNFAGLGTQCATINCLIIPMLV